MAMASSETKLTDFSFLGLYLEAQAVFIDQNSKTANTDRYGIINAGALLPISTNNRLQFIVEFNKTLYKKHINSPLSEGNESAITPALRYVTEKWNFTAGAQILSKNIKGYENTTRWIGTFGYKF
jgi:hypothetical protein